jgi:hypothetical protein
MDHLLTHSGILWPTTALLGLGLFHGINPGMGWLFAVALGMQEHSSRAVWRAMGPLAAGHGLAIGAAIFTAITFGLMAPLETLRVPVAAILIGFGVYRLFRHRHLRFGGMCVSRKELTIWSFLMATAHGAGLMVLPLFLEMQEAGSSSHMEHLSSAGFGMESQLGIAATVAHSLGYLVATVFIGWIVYEKLGVGMLRKAWVNLDLIWAFALVATGVMTLIL